MADKRRRKGKAVDCFAGCGGMSVGLTRAGYNVVGAIESDEAAVAAYRANHPEVRVWAQDIKSVRAQVVLKQLRLKRGELDLLGGCPPCQGFSTLRTYNGHRRVRDEQNNLIYEFLRLVSGLRPKRVMLENVPGLARNRRFGDFRRAISRLGYHVACAILNAADYGVPQNRRRLVFLASRLSPVRLAQPSRALRSVRQAIGKLPAAGWSGDRLHDMPEKRSSRVLARIGRIPKDGGSRTSLPRRMSLKCHQSMSGFKDVYGRMAWDLPAPTITTGCFNPSKGRFLHPSENRGITLREAALLQTFPRNYRFPTELGKVTISRLIGNALPPVFIKRLALSF